MVEGQREAHTAGVKHGSSARAQLAGYTGRTWRRGEADIHELRLSASS